MRQMLLTLAVLSQAIPSSVAYGQGTSFNYQGLLSQSGTPVNGLTDLTFTLFGSADGGQPVGASNVLLSLSVSNGLLNTALDFGSSAFDGSPRWVEIAARPSGLNADFVALKPRQALSPTPYALYASRAGVSASAASVSGLVPASQITGTLPLGRLPGGVLTNGFGTAQLSGFFSGSGAGLSNINLSAVSAGRIRNELSIPSVKSYPTGLTPMSIATYDPKHDGRPSLVLANYNDSVLDLQLNDGKGVFARGNTLKVGKFPACVIAPELFRDGRSSLVTADSGSDTLTVIPMNFGGTPQQSFPLAVGKGPMGVVAADVNGDGFPDLISANSGANTLTVLTNNQNGNFVFSATLPVGVMPMSVAAGDIDGDGRVDLIAANNADNTLTLLMNRPGGFAPGISIAVGAGPRCVIAPDLNGDGAPDLVSANYGDGNVTILMNSGAGVFLPPTTVAVGPSPFSVVAADLHGTGTPDLVTANTAGAQLAILFNQGGGKFVLDRTVSVGKGPQGLVAVDLNRDGFVDLVAGNTSDTPKATFSVVLSSLALQFTQNVGIGTATPATKLDVNGEITCTAVNITSDRNAKEAFEEVDPQAVLERLSSLPITRWQYRSQPEVRHIGPMAQDFFEAFAVGHDPRHIAGVDEDGVALAAIQGLNAKLERKLEEKDQEIARWRETHQALEERLAALERRLSKTVRKPQGSK